MVQLPIPSDFSPSLCGKPFGTGAIPYLNFLQVRQEESPIYAAKKGQEVRWALVSEEEGWSSCILNLLILIIVKLYSRMTLIFSGLNATVMTSIVYLNST